MSAHERVTGTPQETNMIPEFIWWVVHNAIAHPLLVTHTRWASLFHDWTAGRMAGPASGVAIRKAVCALVRVDGKVLAVSRRGRPGDLGLPGGKVDAGEGLEEAIVREVREETGLDFRNIRKVFVEVCKGDVDYETTTFVGEVSGTIREEPGLRVCWVPEEELLTGSFGEYNRKLFGVEAGEKRGAG